MNLAEERIYSSENRSHEEAEIAIDVTLIRRFQEGDTEAFDQLFERHRERAYRYAYRFTKDADLADDMVAVAFTRAYRALGDFQKNSAFTTWLYRIIMNYGFDLRRGMLTSKAQKAFAHVDSEFEHGKPMAAARMPDPQEEAEQAELALDISLAISELKPSYRDIIEQFHINHMSHAEIVELTHLPLGTVKSRLFRASHELQNVLVKHGVMVAA